MISTATRDMNIALESLKAALSEAFCREIVLRYEVTMTSKALFNKVTVSFYMKEDDHLEKMFGMERIVRTDSYEEECIGVMTQVNRLMLNYVRKNLCLNSMPVRPQ